LWQPRFDKLEHLRIVDVEGFKAERPKFRDILHQVEWDKVPKTLQGLNITANFFGLPSQSEREFLFEDLCAAVRSNPQLKELSLFDIPFVDLSLITLTCSALRVLCVRGVIVTDESLSRIASCCQLLETLVLLDTVGGEGRAPVYTGAGVRAITKNCRNLRHLELRCNMFPSDSLLSDIFGDAQCTQLTSVCVEGGPEGFLSQVVDRLPHVEELCVWSVTPEQVITAAQALPCLRRLQLSLTGPFNLSQIESLAAALSKVEDLYIYPANLEYSANQNEILESIVQHFKRYCCSPAIKRIRLKPMDMWGGSRSFVLPWTLTDSSCWTSPYNVWKNPKLAGCCTTDD
jgi:hypothetical protein